MRAGNPFSDNNALSTVQYDTMLSRYLQSRVGSEMQEFAAVVKY